MAQRSEILHLLVIGLGDFAIILAEDFDSAQHQFAPLSTDRTRGTNTHPNGTSLVSDSFAFAQSGCSSRCSSAALLMRLVTGRPGLSTMPEPWQPTQFQMNL